MAQKRGRRRPRGSRQRNQERGNVAAGDAPPMWRPQSMSQSSRHPGTARVVEEQSRGGGGQEDAQRRRGLSSASGESALCLLRKRAGFCGVPFTCTSK